MRYKFKCDTKAGDCWKLYMNRMYHSMIGVCSLVFALAMIALSVRFWNSTNGFGKFLLVFACLLVPVIQPLGVYMRCAKQTVQIPKGMELWFGDEGIYIRVGEKTDNVPWKKVRSVSKASNMVIIIVSDGRGYMLTDRVLGQEKESFFDYVSSCIS